MQAEQPQHDGPPEKQGEQSGQSGGPPGQYGAPQQGGPPGQYGAPQPGGPPEQYGAPQPGGQPGQYGGPPPGGYVPPPQPGAQPSGTTAWMQAPPPPPNCPPGLEYLGAIDQLLVKQQVELLEAFTGFETANKYAVLNSMGQQVYFAAEDSDCCSRQCFGPMRPFDMGIHDNYQREVIHLCRPLRCTSCWFPCFLQQVEVQAPRGTVIGYVKQSWSILAPKYEICDAAENIVLRIEGPLCYCDACWEVEFNVTSADGSAQVGRISKQWSGLVKELFTDADNFGITFPADLDVKIKAVLLAAVFLIDFMYFEKANESRHHRHF